MEKNLKVTVLSHTPEFEQNIVRGARLCYSSADIEELKNQVTPENAEKFLNMILEIGHGSVLEHSSITFGIEGVSRSLTHQLVRHRIGSSYSQKSQRYVSELDFDYVVPEAIKKEPAAYLLFKEAMKQSQVAYENIYHNLLCQMIKQYSKRSDVATTIIDGLTIDETLKRAKAEIPYIYNTYSKLAAENARAVLPNACETKIQVTMNTRALFHFFEERLCNRAQDEIREMAYQMWLECMKIAPIIFKHAVPTCVNGKCKEGKMTCGKVVEVKEKFIY